jgi:hypothetical protein
MVDVSALRREVSYVLKEDGLDEGTRKLRDFGAANQDAAAKAEILTRQQRAQEESVQRVAARLESYAKTHDPVYRAQEQVERGERLVAAARARGVEVTDAQIGALAKARQRFDELSQASNDNVRASGLQRHEWINLSRQAQDVVVSLAGGQKPMTVLLQQGSQIADVFSSHKGGAGAALASVASTIGGMISPLTIATAAFVALGVAAVDAALGLAGKLKEIDEASRKAGVSSDFFQVWTRQARTLRVEVDDLQQALDRAKQAMAETIEKGQAQLSPGAKFLVDLEGAGKISRGDLASYLNADTADAKLTAVLETMRKLLAAGREVEALRLGEAFFGAPELVDKIAEGLRAGKLNLAELLQQARDGGTILDKELVQRSHELDERLRAAKDEMERGLKPVLHDLASLGLDIKEGWVSTVEALARASKAAADLYGKLKPIGDLLEKLSILRSVYARLVTDTVAPPADAGPFTEENFLKQPRLRNIAAENRQSFGPTAADVQAAVDANREAASKFLKGLEPPAKTEKSGGSASKTKSLDEVERYIRSLERQNAALEGEAAALGKSNVEREQSIALARAEEAAKERGKSLTEEETQRILRSAEAHATLREKIDEATKARQRMEETQRAFASGAESAIERLILDNQKLVDVLKDVVKELERAALKQALLGGDGKSGALGTIVNAISGVVTRAVSGGPIPTMAQGGYGPDMPASMLGQLAEGTDNWRGGWSWVGENGPELLNLPRGSQVVPNAESVDYVRSMARMVGAGRALSAPPVLVQGPRLDLSGLAALGAGRAAPATTVNIHKAPAEARAEETTDSEGGRHVNINLMAGELLERGLATQRGRAAMAMYGVRPGIVKR